MKIKKMKNLSKILSFTLILSAPLLSHAAEKAYIPNYGDSNVSVIDAQTRAVVATSPAISSPKGVAYHPSREKVYVTQYGSPGRVCALNTQTNAFILPCIVVGNDPSDLLLDQKGERLYVANRSSGTISVVNTQTDTVIDTIRGAGAVSGLALNSSETRLYAVADTRMDAYSVPAYDLVGSVAFTNGPNAIALSADDKRAYVPSLNARRLFVVNLEVLTLMPDVVSLEGPMDVVLKASENKLYVSLYGNSVGAGTRIAVLSLPDYSIRMIDGFTGPADLQLDSDEKNLYVVNRRGNSVKVLDTTTESVSPAIAVGSFPYAEGSFLSPLPKALLSGTSLNFADLAVGSTSEAQSVTLRNEGKGYLKISSLTTTGDFSQSNSCASMLLPGNSCQIDLKFTPTAGGAREGSLRIMHDESVEPLLVSLSGNGLASASPPPLDSGSPSPGTSSCQLNKGRATLNSLLIPLVMLITMWIGVVLKRGLAKSEK